MTTRKRWIRSTHDKLFLRMRPVRQAFVFLAMGAPLLSGCSKKNDVSQTTVNGRCAGAFQHCMDVPADQCETNTDQDVKHCGQCGNACSRVGGTPKCQAGACEIVCSPGRGDCDGDITNGCETSTVADTSNCGACGHVCSQMHGASVCSQGKCTIVSCADGFADCDTSPESGCETDLRSDKDHCGMCAKACPTTHGTATCSNSQCALACGQSFHLCAGRCVADSSITECGATCEACQSPDGGVAACVSGKCDFTCTTGIKCGGTCVQAPSEFDGVFVVAGSKTPTSMCGKRLTPCPTIQSGIVAAFAAGLPYVRVAAGKYVEQLSLKNGVIVQGGWSVSASGDWSTICDSASAQAVQILGPTSASYVVRAASLHGKAALETLSISNKPTTSLPASSSLYAIMATDSSTELELKNVVVVTGPAADGVAGAAGTDGAKPINAIGTTCSEGANGVLAGADGVASIGGTFGPAGFVAGNGTAAKDGDSGHNGAPGGAGATLTGFDYCTYNSGSCVPGGTMINHPHSAPPGSCGGGGGGGGGGKEGTGGGSSIGVYVWDAKVTILSGAITAGNGGAGGAGGAAGKGVAGAAGVKGDDWVLCTSCNAPVCDTGCNCKCNSQWLTGGPAGGPGGNGKDGGEGGGGAGGSSYAVYVGGTGNATISGAELAHGTPGPGGGAPGLPASKGEAADRFPPN